LSRVDGARSAHDASLRVLLWGTYDLGKPRNRILRAGLRMQGVLVDEIHASVWEEVRDKGTLGVLALIRGLLRASANYPRLVWRFLRAPVPDVVVVGYLGQLDVLVLRPFARLRRVPVVWDQFLSLHDTMVEDRRRFPRWHPLALLLYLWEWLACRACDLVVLDTEAHAEFVARHFGLPRKRVASVWVGAEEDRFPLLQPPRDRAPGPVRVLHYGQLIPLHGIATILDAARRLAHEPFRFVLIGSGQEELFLRAALSRGDLPNVEWIPWVPYEELVRHLAEADICLGIFGASGKAERVIPNKVFQIVTAGRPLITRDSPAIRELFPVPEPGLIVVPAADPEALVEALRAMALRTQEPLASHFSNLRTEIGTRSIGSRWASLFSASRRRRA
jgi:glycosyltransferase involved in cell wall biosynthesis